MVVLWPFKLITIVNGNSVVAAEALVALCKARCGGACVVYIFCAPGHIIIGGRSASHVTLANSPRVCCCQCIGDTVDGVRFPDDSVPSALRTRPRGARGMIAAGLVFSSSSCLGRFESAVVVSVPAVSWCRSIRVTSIRHGNCSEHGDCGSPGGGEEALGSGTRRPDCGC